MVMGGQSAKITRPDKLAAPQEDLRYLLMQNTLLKYQS